MDLMWGRPLSDLVELLGDVPSEAALVDASLKVDEAGGAHSQSLACSALLRVGAVSGFELTFQVPPGTHDMSWLVAWSFGDSLQPLILTASLGTGEYLTARCRHLADSRFDLSNNSARGAFTSLFIEIARPTGDVATANDRELVVGEPAWLPRLAVQSDGCRIRTAQHRGAPSIELPSLNLEHHKVGASVLVRILRADDEDPDGVFGKVLDSMSFLAGCRLFPRLMRFRVGARAILRVFRRRESSSTRMPPVPTADGGTMAINAWKLFAALYRFQERQPESAGHRCSLIRAMAEVHGAMRAEYISTKALIVSIAVESLVKDYVVGSPPLAKAVAEEYASAAKAALVNVPESVVAACCDTIGRMATPNTHNALMALAGANLVDSAKAKRWRDVRAKLAHGHLSDPDVAAEAFRLSLDLFHRIAASVSGFDGVVLEHGREGETRAECGTIPPALRRSGATY